jgi:hypothetical protein
MPQGDKLLMFNIKLRNLNNCQAEVLKPFAYPSMPQGDKLLILNIKLRNLNNCQAEVLKPFAYPSMPQGDEKVPSLDRLVNQCNISYQNYSFNLN